MDLVTEARELVQNLACRIGPSPYDIAWLARVPVNGTGQARWPALVDWLVNHQWPDGSWGGAIPYCHDRILCTLAAMLALKEHGRAVTGDRVIERAERYIWTQMHRLHQDPVELVGFELLLPTLLAEARSLGLSVPSHSCGYGATRAAKLRLLPEDMIYSPGTSVAFSLEFLGKRGDPERLGLLPAENGAVACSPATTAYLLRQTGEQPRALQYLERMRVRPQGIPHFYPYRTFELAWVLEHLAYGGLSLADPQLIPVHVWDQLQAALSPKGTSMDPGFGINDGDTTAVVMHVLGLGRRSLDPASLRHFEDAQGRIFRTFRFERNASVSTNAHALEVLALLPDYPDRKEVWTRVVTMLLATKQYQSYWTDKWHASPFYATAHVLISLLRVGEPLISECQGVIDWVVHMQREDGAWGFYGISTAEETAYALLALLQYHRKFGTVDASVMHRGARFLLRQDRDGEGQMFPDLWIAKSLFAPQDVIRSAIVAALYLYQDTFGTLTV